MALAVDELSRLTVAAWTARPWWASVGDIDAVVGRLQLAAEHCPTYWNNSPATCRPAGAGWSPTTPG